MDQKNQEPEPPETGKPSEPNPAPDAESQAETPAAPQDDPAELRRKAGEYDKLMDRLRRVTADYVNSQRRTEQRAEERTAYAIESFARELVVVVDDLARAVRAARKHATPEHVSEGLDMVEKHLYAVLARHGITPIETKAGDAFDSNLHEALSVVQTDDMPPNRVVEEMQKGFRLHGRVLRPARVAVSAPKPKATT